jgi:transposase
MPAATESFVVELPLKTTAVQEQALRTRFEAARQVYNACLGEALRVLELMRESRAWRRARAMPKGPERTKLFRELIERFDFRGSAIERFAIVCKNNAFRGRLGSDDTQKTALRAFQAVKQHSLGKRGRPRFRGRRGLHSVEGKKNAVIRFDGRRVRWLGLSMPVMLDLRDRDGWQKAALRAPTKYCRIVRRSLRGRERWYVQLVQAGRTPRKKRHRVGHGVVGLDIGPSTVAIVGEHSASLITFCPTIRQPWRKMRRLERAMDRSRRSTNPDNYNEDGTVKKGRKTWKNSRRYRVLARQRRETERRLAAERRRAHGELANQVLAEGHIVRTEKLSYSSFQKNFGRSVKVRAPGMFVATLSRKAERAGGTVEEFSTRTTRLSQVCHGCGRAVKKPLSQRWHACDCGKLGEPVQRDLYSAFLARHVSEDRLDARQARKAWPAARPLLRRAASSVNQPASLRGTAAQHGEDAVRAGRPSKGDERSSRPRTTYRRASDARPGGARRDGPDSLGTPRL